MKKLVFFSLFISGLILQGFHAGAQELKIGLFNENAIQTFIFTADEGKFKVYDDTLPLLELNKGSLIYISLLDSQLQVRDPKTNSFKVRQLSIKSEDSASLFILRPAYPAMDARKYQGSCVFSAGIGRIQAINLLSMDDYLTAVVAAEGGTSAGIEYYKAQSILCRTYLLSHYDKHSTEGFNLCDAVHCQAYHGVNKQNPSIHNAVILTKNQVAVFQDSVLITAAFHANCGGETQNSENEWLQNVPYLRSVTDSFCQNFRSSRWEVKVERSKWLNYLSKNGVKFGNNDTLKVVEFNQSSRKAYYKAGRDSIALRKIRADWNLKSSYFSVVTDSTRNIILKGKGYGHGIGMCQVGAMAMAKKGLSYKDILNYYFQGIALKRSEDIISLDRKLRLNTSN